MVVDISLGEVGLAYMCSVLRQCSGAALRLVDIVSKSGKVFAPLPPGTSRERAQQFEIGGISSRTNAFDWMFNSLATKRDGTLILQDIWAQPSDLAVRRPTVESYVSDGRHVYYFLPSFLLSPSRLANLLRQISSFQMVGFYISDGFKLTFEQRRQHYAPAEYFDRLTPLTTTIYISAYDQESWVVWQSEIANQVDKNLS